MRIAIIGSGAIGTYYGAKLAAGGSDVHFLVRNGFEQVRKRGLYISGPGEELRLPQVNCYRSANEIGKCDLVLIAVKTTSNQDLLDLIPPLIGNETLLLTLQNGLGNDEFLSKHFGPERVLGGLCFVCLDRSEPGIVKRSDHGYVRIGEYGRCPGPRTHAVALEFKKGGIDCGVVDNLALERWRKLVWNIPFNGLSVVARVDTAAILNDPELRKLTIQLMQEVVSAANKCGLPLPTSVIDDQIRQTETIAPYKPSTLVDFENSNPLEIEAIWGEPLKRAQAVGALVPCLQKLYSDIKSLDQSSRRRVHGP